MIGQSTGPGTDWAAKWAQIRAQQPRDMPRWWAPDMTFEGDKVIAHAREHGLDCNLGFVLTRDPTQDGRLIAALWQSVWQALELARLGRTDELKVSGVIQ